MLLASNTPREIITHLAAGLCRKPPPPAPEFPTRRIPSRLRARLRHRDPEPSPCEVFNPQRPSKIFGSRGSASCGAARCLCSDPNPCCQKSWRAHPCAQQHPEAQHRAGRRRHRVDASHAQGPAPSPSPSPAAPALQGRGWAASGGEVAAARVPPWGTGSQLAAGLLPAGPPGSGDGPRCARGWTASCPGGGDRRQGGFLRPAGLSSSRFELLAGFFAGPFLAGLHGTLHLLPQSPNLPVSTRGKGGEWLGWINPILK